MTSAWEAIRRDARRSPRYRLSLTVCVSTEGVVEDARPPATLAYTSDVSRDGLCLLMSTTGMGSLDLEKERYVLRLMIVLPDGSWLDLLGEPVFYHLHNTHDYIMDYLVGVRLTESKDLARYHEFIDALSFGDKSWRLLCPAIFGCAYTLIATAESMI